MKDALTRLWGLLILFAWVPLGLFGLWIEKNMPHEYQMPFFVLLAGGIITYYVVWIRKNEKSLRDKYGKK
jgi:hypothetical protein